MDRVVSDPLSWGEGAMKHKMMLQENSGGSHGVPQGCWTPEATKFGACPCPLSNTCCSCIISPARDTGNFAGKIKMYL